MVTFCHRCQNVHFKFPESHSLGNPCLLKPYHWIPLIYSYASITAKYWFTILLLNTLNVLQPQPRPKQARTRLADNSSDRSGGVNELRKHITTWKGTPFATKWPCADVIWSQEKGKSLKSVRVFCSGASWEPYGRGMFFFAESVGM